MVLSITSLILLSITLLFGHHLATAINTQDDDRDTLTLSILPLAILQESGIRFKLYFKATGYKSDFKMSFYLKAGEQDEAVGPLYEAVSATTTFFFNDETDLPYPHTIGEDIIPPFPLSFIPDPESKGSFQTPSTIIPFTPDTTTFDPKTMNVDFYATGFIYLQDIQTDLLLQQKPPTLSIQIEPTNPEKPRIFSDSAQIVYYQDIFSRTPGPIPPLIFDYLLPSLHPLDFVIPPDPNRPTHLTALRVEKKQSFFSLLLPTLPIRIRGIDIHFNGAVKFDEDPFDLKTLPICVLNNDLNSLQVFLAYDRARFPVLHIELRKSNTFWFDHGTTSKIVCTGGLFEPSLVRGSDHESDHVGCTIAVEFQLFAPDIQPTIDNSSNSLAGFNPKTFVHHYMESAIKRVFIPGYEPYYPKTSLGQYSYSSELDLKERIGLLQQPITITPAQQHLSPSALMPTSTPLYEGRFRTVISATFIKTVQFPFPPNLTPPTLYIQVELQWPLLSTSDFIAISTNYFVSTVSPTDHTETLKYFGQIDEEEEGDSEGLPVQPGFWKSVYLQLPEHEPIDFVARKIQFMFTIQHSWILRKPSVQAHPTVICSIYSQVQRLTFGITPPIQSQYDSQNVLRTFPSLPTPTSNANTITNTNPINNSHQHLSTHTPNAFLYINDTIVVSGAHSFTFNADISSVELQQFHMIPPKPALELSTSRDNSVSDQASRDFTLHISFTTKETSPQMSSFLLSLHTEPGYHFFGNPEKDCYLNDNMVDAQLLHEHNSLASVLLFPNSKLEKDTHYSLHCGGNTLSVQFDPVHARLTRSMQINLLAFGTDPIDVVPGKDSEDKDDGVIYPVIPRYSRSIYVPPDQIVTDEMRRRRLYIILAFIGGGIVTLILLIISIIMLIKCCRWWRKRREEYDKLMFAADTSYDEVVQGMDDDWIGEEAYSDFMSPDSPQGPLNTGTRVGAAPASNFQNFGQSRDILKSPHKQPKSRYEDDIRFTHEQPIAIGSSSGSATNKLSINHSPSLREPLVTSYMENDPYDLRHSTGNDTYKGGGF